MTRLRSNTGRAFALAFTVFGVVAIVQGAYPLAPGRIAVGWLLSGLLFLALGISVWMGHPRSRAPLWFLAALPIAATPLGLIMLVVTLAFTIWVRRA